MRKISPPPPGSMQPSSESLCGLSHPGPYTQVGDCIKRAVPEGFVVGLQLPSYLNSLLPVVSLVFRCTLVAADDIGVITHYIILKMTTFRIIVFPLPCWKKLFKQWDFIRSVVPSAERRV